MAKTIKFNLICDNHQVRTLEDLRNHFSIEDILQYYRDKVLEKWLYVRGYHEELEAVKKITSDSPYEIIKELVSIFGVETNNDLIEYSTSIITYREERVLAEQKRKEKVSDSDAQYLAYFKKYEQLTNFILENTTNKHVIQAAIKEIEEQYAWIFEHDYRNFFYKIYKVSPLAVLCLLMNSFTRKFYIFDGEAPTDDSDLFTRDVKEMYTWIKGSFSNDSFLQSISEDVIIKNNETGNRFVTLTPNKCMVIRLQQPGSYKHQYECGISCNADNEHFLTSKEVNDKFLIIDGLQYQSENSVNTLYYIEI